MNNNVGFIDAEARGSRGDEKLSFREIVLLHLKRIGVFASVEMRGGFWNRKPHPDVNRNETIDVYVPDTREVYSNAVEYLFDLLYPYFDKMMMDVADELDAEFDTLYRDSTILVESDREAEGSSNKQGFERRKFNDESSKITYRKERLKVCRRMFRALCCFLKRKDYLGTGSFDEVET